MRLAKRGSRRRFRIRSLRVRCRPGRRASCCGVPYERDVMTRRGRWLIMVVAAFIIVAWPPEQDRSLAVKAVSWIVDPTNVLPTLPGPLAPGLGDDTDAVVAHDSQMSEYDRLYNSSKMMRTRLELKVAKDPFNPST